MPKPITAYKVFYACRFAGPSKGERVLRGPYSNNKRLQKAGDTASVSGTLHLCSNGWHASSKRNLHKWLTNDRWRSGHQALFAVRLSGEILIASDKYCSRTITLLREISYSSVEGRQLRSKQEEVKRKYETWSKAYGVVWKLRRQKQDQLARQAEKWVEKKLKVFNKSHPLPRKPR